MARENPRYRKFEHIEPDWLAGADLNQNNQLGDFSPIGGDDVYKDIQRELEQTDPRWRDFNPRARVPDRMEPRIDGSGKTARWSWPEPWGSDRVPAGPRPRDDRDLVHRERYAQAPGRGLLDSMPVESDRASGGRPPGTRAVDGLGVQWTPPQSANDWLDSRLEKRVTPTMHHYMTGSIGERDGLYMPPHRYENGNPASVGSRQQQPASGDAIPGRGLMDVPAGFDPAKAQSFTNTLLNRRMEDRLPQDPAMNQMHRGMSERIPHMMTPDGYEDKFRQFTGPGGSPKPSGRGLMDGIQGGTDSDMMRRFGPEDQVAYDKQGNPIPLRDPRHPANQRR